MALVLLMERATPRKLPRLPFVLLQKSSSATIVSSKPTMLISNLQSQITARTSLHHPSLQRTDDEKVDVYSFGLLMLDVALEEDLFDFICMSKVDTEKYLAWMNENKTDSCVLECNYDREVDTTEVNWLNSLK